MKWGVTIIVVRGDLHILRGLVLNIGDVWVLAAAYPLFDEIDVR
jgi:hypothetical protein